MGYAPTALYTDEQKTEQINIEITGFDPGTIQQMKENTQFWEKIQRSLQLLFSLEVHKEIMGKVKEEK